MQLEKNLEVLFESVEFSSEPLERLVRTDLYTVNVNAETSSVSLLLVNDGQDLLTMNFESMLREIHASAPLMPLVVAAIHCGEDRKNEYGMVVSPDYKGRGSRALQYERFVLDELLPFLYSQFAEKKIEQVSFAGFSLGGLSAFDLAWNHPDIFKKVGVFSGSFWWRSKGQGEKDFNPLTDRIMHHQVRHSELRPGMRFYLQCGELDEECDRNSNGVIDSIDDTIDLMRELLRKGYMEGKDFVYHQLPDGRHDVKTWSRAFPAFLRWGFAQ